MGIECLFPRWGESEERLNYLNLTLGCGLWLSIGVWWTLSLLLFMCKPWITMGCQWTSESHSSWSQEMKLVFSNWAWAICPALVISKGMYSILDLRYAKSRVRDDTQRCCSHVWTWPWDLSHRIFQCLVLGFRSAAKSMPLLNASLTSNPFYLLWHWSDSFLFV